MLSKSGEEIWQVIYDGSLLSMSGCAYLALESIQRLRIMVTLGLSVINSSGWVPMNTSYSARYILILSHSLLNHYGRQLGVLRIRATGTNSCAWAGEAGGCGC